MRSIDINCDLGELCGNDALIVPWISSANISCGAHVGTAEDISATIDLCKKYGVAIGAHPSWPDKIHFGRKEINATAEETYQLVRDQLAYFSSLLNDASLHHVKPHGAMYNQSAKDPNIAAAIAQAVYDIDPNLILYVLSGSCSAAAAKSMGLKFASEAFADRRYEEDGSLTPRSYTDALIETDADAITQVMMMVQSKKVIARKGQPVSVSADTICIHGDGAHAVSFAQNIYQSLKANQIDVKAL